MRLTIFLWPERGPISPVELDLLDVFRTLAPPRPRDGLGDERLGQLYAAIRRRYPDVRPERNPEGLQRIYASFGHADRFDGVVLRVGGEIPEPPDDRLAPLRKEIEGLRRELQDERGRTSQLADRLGQVAGELGTCRLALAGAREQAETAQAVARQLEEQARADLSRANVRRGELEQANRQLEETIAARDQEIEELRAERREPPPDDLPPRIRILES